MNETYAAIKLDAASCMEDANWQEIFGKPFGTLKALGFFEQKKEHLT